MFTVQYDSDGCTNDKSSFHLLYSFVGSVAQWNECADSSSKDYTDNYTRITVTHNKVGI